MVFLRFLFIAIFVLWLLRVLARLFLPMLFQKMVNKARQQSQPHQRPDNRKPDGTISVDYIPPQTKEQIPPDKMGDFIDYEEVK